MTGIPDISKVLGEKMKEEHKQSSAPFLGKVTKLGLVSSTDSWMES